MAMMVAIRTNTKQYTMVPLRPHSIRRTQNLAVKSKSLKQEHLWAGDTRGKWGSKLTQQKTHPKRLETLGGHKYGMRHVHVQSLSHTFANEGQHDSVMHERMLIQPLGHENWRIEGGARRQTAVSWPRRGSCVEYPTQQLVAVWT